MKEFSLLIKPASADCNLRCEYCFYLSRAALYPGSSVHRMTDGTLHRLVAGYMKTDQSRYVFLWQGGEPCLMGAGFFERATELQARHGRAGAVVSNGLQTNGVLITDEMASHFSRCKFLVGVSLDGPERVHDAWRRSPAGSGSHAMVLRGIDRLKQHRVEFNILALVTRANVRQPDQIYRYFCDRGYLYHQYIPCVEFDAEEKPLPYTIGAEEWGDFLCGLYDAWIGSDTRRVSIRLFDSVIGRLVDGRATACHMEKDCCRYFLVEYNGDVYPCDFFVEKAFRLGNISGAGWKEMAESPAYRRFGAQKRDWNGKCAGCKYLELCAGDCLKNRFRAERDSRALSRLCRGWKQFYDHSLPGFERLARGIRDERNRLSGRRGFVIQEAPGRNDPCPCGSGRKYKRCCLAK